MEELKNELENLTMIFKDLERKKKEKIQRKENLMDELENLIDEIENLNKEMENIQPYIIEKQENKKAWEQEIRSYYKEPQYKESAKKRDFDSTTASAISSSFFYPPIAKGRIIPVNNDGVPVEQLGESKWTRKK